MKRKTSILIVALVFFFAFSAHFSWGASYDIYVDKNYEGDEEGTSKKPFKTIGAALEKASENDKIYIKNGTYEEQLILKKGIGIYGEEKNKTIIKGKNGATIKGEDKNVIRNITVFGGNSGIIFEKKGEVQNCIIKNVTKNAIEATAGNSEIEVLNSKIIGNGKGIYVQKGRSITIEKNEFSKNSEEGIDLRQKIRGTIHNNEIIDNGEGGIEIIIGSSDVSIKNNIIKKNKSSGIAAQFYSQASKTGKVEIKNNTIASNGAYGLVCKAPSGGNPAKDYWNDSIELTDNRINNNKDNSISGSCKIIKAVTEEEAGKNQTIESATAQINHEITEQEKIKELEEQSTMELLEKEISLDNLIEEMELNRGGAGNKLDSALNKLKERSGMKNFFLGKDLASLRSAKESLDELRQEESLLEEAINQIGAEEISDSKENGLRIIGQLNNTITYGENLIMEKENKFSLFDWFLKLFNR